MSWITTASGKRFYFGREQRVSIFDIATALGNLCRFTGQIDDWYSVAEHSVHVSYLVPQQHALCGLLHDATEAYVNDLAKPLKRLLPEYAAIEDGVWRRSIAPTFGLPQEMPQCVKEADMAMLKCEVEFFYPPDVVFDLNLPGRTADRTLSLWTPRLARGRFLTRYADLTGWQGAAELTRVEAKYNG